MKYHNEQVIYRMCAALVNQYGEHGVLERLEKIDELERRLNALEVPKEVKKPGRPRKYAQA